MDSFVFLGFGIDAWITLVTVFAMFSVLLFTRMRSDVVFLCAVGILYVTGVLDAKEALSGISQTSVAVVGVLFVNIVKMWSKKLGISPSKLLIPLSYASGMGGVCTLIGTPPNLIILAANILIVNLVYPLTPLP